MESNRAPSLPEVLRAHVTAGHKTRFGGWMPGRIESYDSAKHKATVQLLLEDTETDETGEDKKVRYPIINEVPVQTLGDGYGIRIELALKKGDYVTVLFAARSTDRWVQQGGIVDPDDERDHDLNDAIAIPGLFDFAHVKKTSANITFTESEIHAGGSTKLMTVDDGQAFSDGIDARIAALTPGLPGTATEIDTLNAVKNALPIGWPSGTSILKGG